MRYFLLAEPHQLHYWSFRTKNTQRNFQKIYLIPYRSTGKHLPYYKNQSQSVTAASIKISPYKQNAILLYAYLLRFIYCLLIRGMNKYLVNKTQTGNKVSSDTGNPLRQRYQLFRDNLISADFWLMRLWILLSIAQLDNKSYISSI